MRFRALVEQFLKFGVVGAVAFVIDYGILMLLSQVVGWDPLPSSVVSFVVSLLFNYVASMHFVFERRDDLSRRRELVIFVALSVIGLGINSAVIWAGTAALGDGAVAVTATKLVATVVVAVWNFVSRKRWLEAR
ncbi:GtrA family protein [Thermophilibacter mediterraneus]|uniref:GtrA family protein n=1 Tax=Thermophilibacter mediterraneus TaxID=1871031 RepID=UPI0023560D4F|nr:GtrA family protein [Thermophilibacter mediterraneus]